MRFSLRNLLILPSLACFAGAYRFGSHGFRDSNSFCIGLATVGIALGALLLAIAFWPIRQPAADKG